LALPAAPAAPVHQKRVRDGVVDPHESGGAHVGVAVVADARMHVFPELARQAFEQPRPGGQPIDRMAVHPGLGEPGGHLQVLAAALQDLGAQHLGGTPVGLLQRTGPFAHWQAGIFLGARLADAGAHRVVAQRRAGRALRARKRR